MCQACNQNDIGHSYRGKIVQTPGMNKFDIESGTREYVGEKRPDEGPSWVVWIVIGIIVLAAIYFFAIKK